MNIPKNHEELLAQERESGVKLPYTDDISVLATPVTVGKKTIPNRIVYQAMEGCDSHKDGTPDELTKRRYRRFAEGGAGLIWYEATAVLPEGRANPRQSYIEKANLDAFKREVAEIKETCIKANGYEPVVICQLTHSGRYSKPEGTPAPLVAYNNPIFEKDNPLDASRIVTDDYLDLVKEKLVAGAALAEEAGFDGADIKCCHRYLLSETLSAYERKGKYGGSFENRTRLFRESVKGAKEQAGADFIVTSRMNIYDGFPYPYGFGVKQDKGITFERGKGVAPGCADGDYLDAITPDFTEAVLLVKELASYGISLLDFTMGNPYFNPHVNRPYAKGGYDAPEHPLFGVYRMLDGIRQVRAAIPDVKVISSGISYLGGASAGVTAAAILDGWFDFAGYGREILAYPDVAKTLVSGNGLDPKKLCVACGKCTEIMRRPGGTPGCVVRDTEIYAPLYRKLVLGKDN